MITGFDTITAPLTESEKAMMLIIVSQMEKRYNSKGNFVTSEIIVNGMRKQGHKISGARLRKIMNHVRIHSIAPILANSNGYWFSNDANEIQEQIISLKERADAILAAGNGLKKFL